MLSSRTVIALLLVALAAPALGLTKPPSRNFLETPHNLSTSGGGGDHDLRSTQEARVCIFCHTPHHAQSVAPLWSRADSEATIYVPYSSPTLRSNPQQPKGASRLCLSCHDGTIALGQLADGVNLDAGLAPIPYDTDPQRNANLGTDLADDHPISFAYLPGAGPELADPGSLPGSIRLEEGIFLECTACHDPHDNQYGNFLALDATAQKDLLCTSCHRKNGWDDPDAAHRTGGSRYLQIAPQVAAQGCLNCHLPHNGAGRPYLLRAEAEEMNCLAACHRDAPFANVWSEFFATAYNHPVADFQSVHRADPDTKVEEVPVAAADKHVECVDCHNPHRAGWQGAPLGAPSPSLPPASVAPAVSGPLRGVRGVDKSGSAAVTEARFEYEICFKCHAGPSADRFVPLGDRPIRQFATDDQSQRFAFANPSFHPVTEDRPGSGRSLRAELQAGMLRIYCTDCHAPHGSNEPHLLRLSNWDTYPALGGSYPLCFRCHDQDYLLDPTVFPRAETALFHRSHVIGHNAPCSACHDPHGVPAAAGAAPNSGGHLVNFDLRYAGPAPVYDAPSRSCSVSCHTNNPRSI